MWENLTEKEIIETAEEFGMTVSRDDEGDLIFLGSDDQHEKVNNKLNAIEAIADKVKLEQYEI